MSANISVSPPEVVPAPTPATALQEQPQPAHARGDPTAAGQDQGKEAVCLAAPGLRAPGPAVGPGKGICVNPGPFLALDFETYYDRDYTLEKQNIPEYVLDQRFHAHGLAVCHPDGHCEFRTDVAAVLQELRATYGEELEQVTVVAHNAAFDCFILAHRFNQIVRHPMCTVFAAHLVHGPGQKASLRDLAILHRFVPKGSVEFMKGVLQPTPDQMEALAEYACHDVELTRRLILKFQPVLARTPREIAAIAHTVRMFVERPFVIDTAPVDDGLVKLDIHVADVLLAGGYTHEQISKNSLFTPLLAGALGEIGESVPMKAGKNGPIPALARNDESMMGLRRSTSAKVRTLADLRVMVRSAPQARKRLEYLRRAAAACAGKCHFEIVYHRAQHGRYAGGGGFNIQNVTSPDKCREPFQKETALCIRRAICAPPGFVLVAADAAQIEARVLAWLAGQTDLHAAFASKKDIYSEFASEVFGREVRKLPPEHPDAGLMKLLRNVGKTAILGLGYGMGAERFVENMKSNPDGLELFANGLLDVATCAKLVYRYRDRFPAIQSLWRAMGDAFCQVIDGGAVRVRGVQFYHDRGSVCMRLPSGRTIVYPAASLEIPEEGEEKTYLDREGHEQSFLCVADVIKFGNNHRLYGPKLVEHAVSGIARDILVQGMLVLEKAGWPVITHCHDEIVCVAAPEKAAECLDVMLGVWRNTPAWAPGLVLDAEGKWGRNLAEIK